MNCTLKRGRSRTMSRDKIDKKLFEKIKYHPKMGENVNEAGIRNAICNIHKKNPGITMNASACEFAKSKNFSVFRYLSSADKASLANIRSEIEVKQTHKVKLKQIKQPTVNSLGPFAQEAYVNANIYPYIYTLENNLRKVILDEFGTDIAWWQDSKIVINPVRDYQESIKAAEGKNPWLKQRGEHPVYYVGLNELFKIIEKNWSKFKPIFNNDLEQLRAWIKESIPIRNLVAHNVKTQSTEQHRMQAISTYIYNLIQNSKK